MITPEQAAARVLHIGGSDAPVIAGQVGSRLELWLEKTGRAKAKPTNAAMTVGNFIERGVVDWAAHRLGKEIQRDLPTLVHSDTVRAANLDGLIPEDLAIVEAKTSGILSGRVFESDMWGEDGTDVVPPRVQIQGQHNLDVATDYYGVRYSTVIVPALLVGIGLVIYRVPHSDRLSQILADIEGNFWEENVRRDIPPDDEPAELDTLKRVIRAEKKIVRLDDALVSPWRHARDQRLAWSKEEERRLVAVVTALGDAEIGQCSDGQFTYLEQHRDAYSVEPTSFRVPRWKQNKEKR